MTVFDCLKPSVTLSAVGNDDKMLRRKQVFLLLSNARGGDTIVQQMPGVFPGGCSRLEFTRTLLLLLLW